MISVWWAVLAFLGGGCTGLLLVGLMRASRYEPPINTRSAHPAGRNRGLIDDPFMGELQVTSRESFAVIAAPERADSYCINPEPRSP